jgi:NADH-quinone oxidoreductase subunit F
MSRTPSSSPKTIDLAAVERMVRAAGTGRDAAIPILQAIQAQYRYLPEAALRRVCELTEITPAQIAGVATFYNQFRHAPVGEHIIRVCHGTACHVAGAPLITDALRRHLGLKTEDQDTDRDGRFTVEKVPCLGCCTLAPVLQIDDVTYGHLTPQSVPQVLEDFLRRTKETASSAGAEVAKGPQLGEIRIGLGSCCQAQGSAGVREAINATLAETGSAVVVKRVGCVGMCHQTPLVEVRPAGGEPRLFAKVKASDAREIVLSQFRPRGLVRRMAYEVKSFVASFAPEESARERAAGLSINPREDPVCAFLGPQQHVATEFGGQIDPTNLDEYLKHDGFKALQRCLTELDEEKIIAEVRTAGLRGRGGAGFPTGVKWATVRAAQGERKYAICNGDEGDPGAFMDRMILESFPYRVIEGLAIAARAVGAHEAVFYIRAEYPLATERIAEAIRKCEERGILGPRVMGHDFALHVTLKMGAGAFVCGEETALVASVEGRRGMPRLRPPYPAEHGLWGLPTLVNNVETYACVPWIIRHGGAAFAAMGTPTSRGTKVFALAGRIKRGGLIEVPMGVTLRRIVEEIGGGTKSGRPFKAVQVGGPSGGCIPASMADTPVDYEDLARAGSIMGSGGLVVLDEGDCMVDIARYFLSFTQDQSCGKCTFCRIGTKRMLEILERLCAGQGRAADLAALEELSDRVRRTSLCGLGRTAPNPVISTLRHFRDEYEAHLAGRCPAKRCPALIKYHITDKCIGCTRCAQRCPVDAIAPRPYEQHEVDLTKCVRCGICQAVCPVDAVEVETGNG